MSSQRAMALQALISEVLHDLYREVEKVESFYISKLRAILREKTELDDRYNLARNQVQDALPIFADREESGALLKSLLKISAELAELQQFGALNEEGVLNILGKVSRSRKENVLEATKYRDKTDQSAFVHQTQVSTALWVVGRSIEWVLGSCLKQEHQLCDPTSAPSGHDFRKTPHDVALNPLSDLSESDLQSEVEKSPDSVLLRDGEGNTPLHLAVIAGTAVSIRSLLEVYSHSKTKPVDDRANDKLQSVLVELLPLAVSAICLMPKA
ncbi:MAG: hypothetical protein Q9190_003572 [Brigantiaea leucoxantha]